MAHKIPAAAATFVFNLFFFFSSLSILFPISTKSSNILASHYSLHQPQHHFDLLNVPSSIHKTLQPFSIPTNTLTPTLKNSSMLSLSLHPHVSVANPPHQNYSALTRSRLASDSARLNSINSRLHHHLPISRTQPVQKVIQPHDLQSPITSGKSHGTYEYLARVGLGQPVKEFYMAIDTGSDVNWLQCQPCDSCYEQSDPIFDPTGSSTYGSVSCDSEQCSSLKIGRCDGDTCQYYESYGDGSFTSGELATETVRFGDSGSVNNVAIGCGHDNEGLFHGLAGLIGLGVGALSLPSQIKATSFSYCLVDMDSHSFSTLEFNSAPPSDSVIVPIVHNPKFDVYFYVDLVGMSVAGEQVPIQPSIFELESDGSGGVIVDSGTVVTRLVTQAYNSLRDTFVKHAQKSLPPSTSGFAIFDTCYDLSSVPSDVMVPAVSFHFSGGKTWSFKSRNCLVPVDSMGKFCFAFAPSYEISIIGNILQQETRVTYDLANKLIGFSPNKC